MTEDAVVDEMADAELHEHDSDEETDEESCEIGVGVARELDEAVDGKGVVPVHIVRKERN